MRPPALAGLTQRAHAQSTPMGHPKRLRVTAADPQPALGRLFKTQDPVSGSPAFPGRALGVEKGHRRMSRAALVGSLSPLEALKLPVRSAAPPVRVPPCSR